jgi:uncharacterized membrane-anchored protein
LNFAVARAIGRVVSPEDAGSHVATLELDQRRVGTYVRLDDGAPLKPGEARLRFRMRSGGVWLGANAFFFQEGDAERYSGARFGEFRVNEDGEAMLVDLRDKDLQKMGGSPAP